MLVHTRENMPVRWSIIKKYVAAAFFTLAKLEPRSRCIHLLSAKENILLALEIYSPEHMPNDHKNATTLLADIEAQIAEHCPGTP